MTKLKTLTAAVGALAAALTLPLAMLASAHTDTASAATTPTTATPIAPHDYTTPTPTPTHTFGCVTDRPGQFTGASGGTAVMLVLDHALCLGTPTTGTVMWSCTVDGHTVTGGDTFTATATPDAVTLAMDSGGPNVRLWIAPPDFFLPAGTLGPCPHADMTLKAGV